MMKKLFVSLVMLAVFTSGSVVLAQQDTKACDKQKTECTKSCAKSDDKKCCKQDSKECCKDKKEGDAKQCCSDKKADEKKTAKKAVKKSSGKK